MDYLVSAENKQYYHWQLELLIESFKHNNCEENLVILLARHDAEINPLFRENLIAHKRCHGYPNIGETRGFFQLNELYGLLWANMAKQVQQPFALIQPDMIFRKPLNIYFSKYSEILFQPNPFFTFDSAFENVGPFWEWIGKSKSDFENKWIPLGPLIVFSQIPNEFFELAINRAEKFAVKQLLNGKPIWEMTTKLALATIISENTEKILCRGDYLLVEEMMEGGSSPFISYEKGLAPTFHKSMFKTFLLMGDPMKILAETFPSPNAHYMSILAKKSLENRYSSP